MNAEVGIRAYARHQGVRPSVVEKAIRNGRLERSVRRDARGRPRINVAAGDLEWERNKDANMDRPHNHVKRGKRLIPLDELNPPVAAVYQARELLRKLAEAVWRMRGREADCAVVLDFLQNLPTLLRRIEDGMAEGGIPLFTEDRP